MMELPRVIRALLDPAVYPEPVPQVELAQTQISYVLLAGGHVYKIKKPVDMGFLDYSTLEKRRYFCNKEVELNRRLCPDAYLGVVAVTDAGGNITLGGRGEVVEYAVKMVRLPREMMLDMLIQKDGVSAVMVEELADRLAAFHRTAAASDAIAAFGSPEMIARTTLEENFGQIEKYTGTVIPERQYRHLRDYTARFLAENVALLKKRQTNGRIRDCHGDLHADHICFWRGICIYDCIEFNDRLRYIDVAAEVAFLAMDLDHYGRADLADLFIKHYTVKSGDRGLLELLDFYKCYRACVRGKVGCFQYADPFIPAAEKEKILANARSYFDLAESYTGRKTP